MRIKSLIVFFYLFHTVFQCFSQLQIGDIRIISVMIDACGNEDYSEFVELEIGSKPIHFQDFYLEYSNPKNAFAGEKNPKEWKACKNNNTQANLVEINKNKSGCGEIKEPGLDGLIPAGAKVHFIRSDLMNPNDHKYTDISEDIYIIFYCTDFPPLAVINNNINETRGFAVHDLGTKNIIDNVEFNSSFFSPKDKEGNKAVFEKNWKNINDTKYVNYNCNANIPVITTSTIKNTTNTETSITTDITPGTKTFKLCKNDIITLEGSSKYLGEETNVSSWKIDETIVPDKGEGTLSASTGKNITFTATKAGFVKIIFNGGVKCVSPTAVDYIEVTIVDPVSDIKILTKDPIFCVNKGSLELEADASGFWSEESSSGNSITSGQNTPKVNVNGIGTYRVTIDDPNQCGLGKKYDEIKVTKISPDATILVDSKNLLNELDLCNDPSFEVTLSTENNSGNPFEWSNNLNTNIVTTKSITITPSIFPVGVNSITYTLTDKSVICGTATASKTINLKPYIGNKSTLSIDGTNICITDGKTTLTANSTNINGTYTWSTTNGSFSPSSDISSSSVEVTSIGTYKLAVESTCGNDEYSKEIKENNEPEISIVGNANRIVCVDETIDLEITKVDGQGVLWYRGAIGSGVLIAGQTGNKLSVNSGGQPFPTNLIGNGINLPPVVFYAVNQGGGCEDVVASFSVTVVAPAQDIIFVTENPKLCSADKSVTLTTNTAGTWELIKDTGDGIIESGNGTNSINVTGGGGIFKITVSDNGCGTGDKSAEITVPYYLSPDTTIIVDSSTGMNLCNAPLLYSISLETNNTGSTYFWSRPGGLADTVAKQITIRATSSSGSYKYTLTDATAFCGTAKKDTTIFFRPVIGEGYNEVAITGNDICPTVDPNTILTAIVPNGVEGNYLWFVPAPNNIVGINTAKTITVNSAANSKEIPVSVEFTSPYGCGTHIDTKFIKNDSPPNIKIKELRNLICSDDTLILKADTTSGRRIVWYKGTIINNDSIPNETKDSIVITSGNQAYPIKLIHNMPGQNPIKFYAVNKGGSCPDASDSIEVTVIPTINEAILSGPDYICSNSSGTLKLKTNATDDETTTYTWLVSPVTKPEHNGIILGDNFVSFSAVGLTTDTVYQVNVKNICSDTTSNELIIPTTFIPFNLQLEVKDTLCIGDTLLLSAFTEGHQPTMTYKWYSNAAELTPNNNPSSNQFNDIPALGSWEYYYEAYNICLNSGVVVESPHKFTFVKRLPVFSVVPSFGENELCVDGTIVLTYDSKDTLNENSIIWSTGDNATSTIVVSKPSVYTLTMSDGLSAINACTNTANYTIVPCPAIIYPPASFTPNGDGPIENEKFYVSGTGILDLQLSIYNRWGIKIFQSKHIDEGWDGRLENGNEAPSGTYMWMAQYYGNFDNGGVNYGTRTGTVMLIR